MNIWKSNWVCEKLSGKVQPWFQADRKKPEKGGRAAEELLRNKRTKGIRTVSNKE